MRLSGTVKDAKNERPISGAKVSLYIEERELAVLYSDSKGEFEHTEAASYLGETLTCYVAKEGYQPHNSTYKVEQDELFLDIELLEVEKEEIKVEFIFKDEKGKPLEDAHINAQVEGKHIGAGLSDKYGFFRLILGPGFKNKILNYKAGLQGYNSVKGKVQLEKETSLEIRMKKAGFPIVWWIVGGVIALESIILGIATDGASIIINNLVLIPLATCIMALIKPVDWVYAALCALMLHEVALLGSGIGKTEFDGYVLLLITILVLASSGVCTLISYLRLKHIRKKSISL